MVIEIKVQIDTDKGSDNEIGEILVDLLTSLKQKLEHEEENPNDKSCKRS